MNGYILSYIRKHMPKTWRRYRKYRQWVDRHFMSPAEVQFAEIMGARAYRLNWWRDPKNHFPFIVLIYNDWFKQYGCVRQLNVRGYFIDFAFTRKRGIEIDSREHHDVVADYDRDQNLLKSSWRVLRIQAVMVNPRSRFYDPEGVRQLAYDFIGPPKQKSGQST